MVIYSILAGNIFYPWGSKFVYIQKIIITKKVNGQKPLFLCLSTYITKWTKFKSNVIEHLNIQYKREHSFIIKRDCKGTFKT